jgi:hypothetical protein
VPSPAKPEITIRFREDRAFLNHPHYLPPDDSDPVDEPFGTAPLSHEAVIELPYALSPDLNRHWLAALAARGDNLTNGMKVWVGVVGGDYISLDIVDGFALHDPVVAEYPAATRIIDEEVLLEIELDSVDKTLDDELSLDHALDNALLLFAGSEILSAFDLELLGVGHYRMSLVRARFDTKRQAHPAGVGVFVVRLTDLARFPHRTSRPSTNYKLQPFTLQHERELAGITPLPFTLAYRARRPLCPLNLRVNGDGRTPTYGAGAGVIVSWDQSDPRRNAEGPTQTLAPAISRTVVELLTVGGVLKQTLYFAPTGPQTITNAQITAALGAETDFVLRAWFESAGRRSLESDQITVRKV